MHKCYFIPKRFPRLTNPKYPQYPLRAHRKFSSITSKIPQAEIDTTRHEALTLQHKIENLLELVFNTGETHAKVKAVGFWRDVLSDAFENLSTAAERPARVVVHGIGDHSGAEDLVTALLDEPLNSDPNHENILRTRWKDSDRVSRLTISTKPTESSSSICLSSSYLTQFSVPLEITELHSSASPTQPLPSSLYKADLPIIVFNPLTTPLSSLKRLSIPSHAIFVASSTPNLNNTSIQHSTQTSLFSLAAEAENNTSQPRLFFVDPSRALSAIQAFRSKPTSTLAIQQYKDNYTGSGIPLLTTIIRSIIDSGINTPSPGAYLRNQTAVIQLRNTLSAFHSHLQDAQKYLDDIWEGVSQLTSKIEETKVRVPHDILGLSQNPEGVVSESLRHASKEMKNVLDKLSWSKTIWRVDDISGIVGGALDRVWCKDLEQKLILQTGRLITLQQEFTKNATTLLHTQKPISVPPPAHTAHSPLFTTHILQNTLSQLTSSPSYTLTPSTLIYPITKRKNQLLQYSTTRMHVKAQRLLVGMSTGVFTSSAFTWAGWMGYLAAGGGHVGEGVWSVVGMGMDPMTGIGVGLLGFAGSVRWAIGKWEKEKKKWWADWQRIGKGLERDLKAAVDRTIQDQVAIIADTACRGLVDQCEKRQGEVDSVKDEVVGLQAELKDLDSRTHRT